MANPFTPSFGVNPPVLAGRHGLIEQFVESLDDGPTSGGRATLYTGPRGSGKTVMLNAVEQAAAERGWVVVSETASPGFIDRITRRHLPSLLSRFDPDAGGRWASISDPLRSGPLAGSTVMTRGSGGRLRPQLERITDVLAHKGAGLLVILDEVHRNQIGELRELATTVQHAFREGRELAFVGAGLASGISDLVNDDVLTFLRRGERHRLGSVSRHDVARAIREPVEASGRSIADDVVAEMVDATLGYPFLIQLVGAQTWRLRDTAPEISMDDARQGVAKAHRRLGSLVHEPALRHTSAVDNRFLQAMAEDDGPSKMADIQHRLAVDVNYASQYRLRLIAAELIESTRHGYVDFALPYLRQYLRQRAGSDF